MFPTGPGFPAQAVSANMTMDKRKRFMAHSLTQPKCIGRQV